MNGHRHRRALAAILMLAASSTPGTARAQSAPTEAETAEGRRHFDRGVLLFDQGDHDGALAEFQRAWELSRRPSVFFNIAAASQALRRYGDAVEALRRFLAETPNAHPRRQEAERALRELEPLLARVRVTLEPPDAVLTLDGRRQPVDRDLLVGPGTHRVEAAREGFTPASEAFTLASGETRALRLSLRPLGFVASGVGATPVGPGLVPQPALTLVGRTTGPSSGDRRSGGTARTLAWVAGGGALVMLGGAAVAVVVREGAVARFNDDARCLVDNGMTRAQTCPGDETTATTAGALVWVGFAAGGALAVTSAVLFLTAPRAPRETARRVGCGLGPGSVGVACGGTF